MELNVREVTARRLYFKKSASEEARMEVIGYDIRNKKPRKYSW